MTSSPTPETVAAGLSEARKRMVLALPADGEWGAVPSRSVAKRAWWNMLPPIIDHKHCPEDRNEWALTDFGMAVRACLSRATEAPHRTVYRSKDGKVQISTNVKGFRWPSREEKVAGLLEGGMIDQAEADRLLAQGSPQ